MKKNVFGRQFKRDHNERKALFKGLMTSLVLHERIQTTEEKAKAIKGSVEKLVTKAVKQGAASERLLLPYLHEDAVKKMITEIAPRFTNRPGGYTRIVRLGRRFNDNASMVVIEWVERPILSKSEGGGPKGAHLLDKGVAKGKKQKTETTDIEATAAVAENEKKPAKKAKEVKKEAVEKKPATKKAVKKEKTK